MSGEEERERGTPGGFGFLSRIFNFGNRQHRHVAIPINHPEIDAAAPRGLHLVSKGFRDIDGVRTQAQVLRGALRPVVATSVTFGDGQVVDGGKKWLFEVDGTGLAAATRPLDNHKGVHLCTPRRNLEMRDFEVSSGAGGSGGMGMVMFATVKSDRSTEPRFNGFTSVAIKTAAPGAEDNLIKEGEIGAVLRHPGIVRHIGVVQWNNSSALVMERCEGSSMRSLLRTGGPLTEIQSLRAMRQLLSAVSYMHHQGIAHLDIKADNVMVGGSRTGPRPLSWKLVDFGLSQRLDHTSVYDKNGSNARCGTIGYMPPDMFIRRRHSPGLCDIWSLGVLFVEMLTGESVFSAPTIEEFRSLITSDYGSLLEMVMDELWPRGVSQETKDLILLFLLPINLRRTAQELLRRVSGLISASE